MLAKRFLNELHKDLEENGFHEQYVTVDEDVKTTLIVDNDCV